MKRTIGKKITMLFLLSAAAAAVKSLRLLDSLKEMGKRGGKKLTSTERGPNLKSVLIWALEEFRSRSSAEILRSRLLLHYSKTSRCRHWNHRIQLQGFCNKSNICFRSLFTSPKSHWERTIANSLRILGFRFFGLEKFEVSCRWLCYGYLSCWVFSCLWNFLFWSWESWYECFDFFLA